MRHVRLIAFEDQICGNLGLGFKGHTSHPEILADTEGTLIAHDLLEHQNGLDAIGCVADELEAIGAIWQVRGRHGMFFMPSDKYGRCLYESLASDVAKCAVDLNMSETFDWWPRFGRYQTREHDYDEDFRLVLEKARPLIVAEMGRAEGFKDYPLDEFLENALHLMRMGFNKARRRFGMDAYGSQLFCAIRDAVRAQAKWVEHEGQEFRLSYGNGEARCEEIYPEEDWL